MSSFEYLSVLISIVVGLGISHLLAGVARLVRHRGRTRFYLPTLLWLATLLLVFIQIWWAMFEARVIEVWTFYDFVLVLAIPAEVYLLAYLLLPERGDGPSLDLREEYFENRRWFFGVLTLVPLTSLAQEYALSGTIQRDANPLFLLAFLLLALGGLATRRDTAHRVIAASAFGLFAAYVTALFLRLV